ncbi:DNA gyrase subunit A [hydrothermal vent metagenome]|uniref:DNA gyrase subunit A n=1 Tax=hydrothermal vent metagenome TaxID=652676 RepID=A0A1W1D198_9ZZZZ
MSNSLEENQDIQEVKIEESMRTSYLDYSMSVIVGRALPDARDGLKPVHRRILYSMRDLNITHKSPYKKSARIVGDCLVAGSLVSTDRGLVPIEDIEVGDRVYTQKGLKSVTELFYQPEQPLLKVTSSSNIFENRVTRGHKFKVLNEDLTYSFKESKDLTTDDYLIMQPSLMDMKDNFSKDEVYALGLFMSDGNIDRNRDLNYVCFSNSEENVLEYIKETFQLNNKIQETKTTKILKISNKEKSKEFLEKFDVTNKYSHNIDINSTIMSFSNKSLLSFISGFIDGDGFIRKNGTNEIVITSISNKFLKKLALLLFDRFGVVSVIVDAGKKGDKHTFENREIVTRHDSYNLTFTGSNAYFFKDKLNLLNQKKRDRLESFNYYSDPTQTSYLPFFGKKIFDIFSKKHIGSGWYQSEDGEKFRLGIKYKNGTKIRYVKELSDKIRIYSDTVEDLNILEKLRRLDSKLYEHLKYIVDNKIRFLRVKEVKEVTDEITYDFTVEDVHEFFVNGVISSNCIGKYHPHGDNAVYDALVRMAQDFSMRSPLVDGQGNFGSVDGDNPAAQRYTEARMTKVAEELLRDIDKDTVDFTPNYDDSMTEPDVLPSRIPNLLLNGSSGIAVGMATNIPPHRMDELIEALLYIIDNPTCEDSELFNIIKGPDFPTGGIIFGKKGIHDAYTTGRGRIKVRAKTHIEEKKNKDVIVVDELPYQVNKSRLIESIAHLVRDKQVEGISEIRDESDREGMRIVIELKKDAMSDIVLNNLFKSTQMQTTFGIIMLAITNKEPKVFKLRELLDLFLRHRKTVIIRRTIFQLEKANAKAHILEGLKIAVDNIDEVIRIIRQSENTEIARSSLIEKFSLSELQANAILEMKLRRLTGLERDKIEDELKELYREIEYYKSILKSEEILNGIIVDELKEVGENFSSKRRTEIVDDYNDIDIEDLIPNEPMVVTITHRGYIKRVALKQYEKQRRGGKGKIAVTTHDDDFIEQFFISSTHDTLMFVTDHGQLYWLKVYRIPEGSRTAKGKAVVNLINLKPDEKIMSIIPTTDFSEDKGLVFFTKNGIVKRTNLKEYSNIRTNGVRAINLDEDDSIVTAKIVLPETKWLFVTTKKGQCIRFKVEDAREIGRVSRGVTAIKFKIKDDFVCGGVTIDNEERELLMLSEKGIGKRTTASEYREQSRAGKGVISMKLSPKTGDVVDVVMVAEDKDMMCLTSIGKMIRVDMQTIRKAGRNTSGVKVVNVDKKDIVVSIAKCPKEEAEEPDAVNDILE